MSIIWRFVLSCGFVLALGAISTPAHADAQEVFVCSFREGKTLDDLMKVAADFKKGIQGMPGGKDYQANVLVPIGLGLAGDHPLSGALPIA